MLTTTSLMLNGIYTQIDVINVQHMMMFYFQVVFKVVASKAGQMFSKT